MTDEEFIDEMKIRGYTSFLDDEDDHLDLLNALKNCHPITNIMSKTFWLSPSKNHVYQDINDIDKVVREWFFKNKIEGIVNE